MRHLSTGAEKETSVLHSVQHVIATHRISDTYEKAGTNVLIRIQAKTTV